MNATFYIYLLNYKDLKDLKILYPYQDLKCLYAYTKTWKAYIVRTESNAIEHNKMKNERNLFRLKKENEAIEEHVITDGRSFSY